MGPWTTPAEQAHRLRAARSLERARRRHGHAQEGQAGEGAQEGEEAAGPRSRPQPGGAARGLKETWAQRRAQGRSMEGVLRHGEGGWGEDYQLHASYTPPATPAPPPAPSFYSSFKPSCRLASSVPDSSLLRWSNPRTWGFPPGSGVPGVGARKDANATIPCGKHLLLDVKDITLHTLTILGYLKVEDPKVPAWYSVRARFIVVRGQLIAGSFLRQFRSRVVFSLLANRRFNRSPLSLAVSPAATVDPSGRPTNVVPVGHKAFVVLGGQVRLHGLPVSRSTPTWTVLNASAQAGARAIVLAASVGRLWPVRSFIAIASSDYDPRHSEWNIVTGYKKHPRGTLVALKRPLRYSHYGDKHGIPDGWGGFIDERAEVGLLSRRILIQGELERAPYDLEGGHLVVFMTATPQYIEGVEFSNMGQQGILGRYPLHFHVCGDMRGRSVVRGNSIHNSNQRCVVLHATHNLRVTGTVAFSTAGHCFVLEEGGEHGNTFQSNLGMMTRRVERPPSFNGSVFSDLTPSTFWTTTMNNSWVGNAAAGSDDSGFWAELAVASRGMSRAIPSMSGLNPISGPVRLFANNVLHSNAGGGLRLYGHGHYPRTQSVFAGLRVYKHATFGVFLFQTANVTLSGGQFADNQVSVFVPHSFNTVVRGCTFLGLSNNLGTRPPRSLCLG